MMKIRYEAKSGIRQLASEDGVRTECLEGVIGRFCDNQFTEAGLPAKLKERLANELCYFIECQTQRFKANDFVFHRALSANRY